MSIIGLRRWLPLFASAMFLGAAAALAWAILSPCQVDVTTAEAKRTTESERVAAETRRKPKMDDFTPLLARRLQAPLFDPPPKPPVVVKKETPPLTVKLLATMPEPGGGCAMFADAGGATLIKSVGDQVVGGNAPIELVEITADHVVVRQEDRLITLKLSP